MPAKHRTNPQNCYNLELSAERSEVRVFEGSNEAERGLTI